MSGMKMDFFRKKEKTEPENPGFSETVCSSDRKELLKMTAAAFSEVLITGILFFRSLSGCLALMPFLYWILKKKKETYRKKQEDELRTDFREVILSISSSLHAGYALSQCIVIALEDLRRLYPEETRPMEEELIRMIRRMEMNIPAEQLFHEMADRTGLEEIRNFAMVIGTVKKQGGNLVKISQKTAEHISRKIQVKEEISQVIAGKKLEKNIMFLMPYFILIYLQITNASYLGPLFHNVTGVCYMAVCLLLIYGAERWADWLIDISI